MTEKYPNRFILDPKYAVLSSEENTNPNRVPKLIYSDEFIYTGRATSGGVTDGGWVRKHKIRSEGGWVSELEWETEIPFESSSATLITSVSFYNDRLFFLFVKASSLNDVSVAILGEIDPDEGGILRSENIAGSIGSVRSTFSDMEADSDGNLWLSLANGIRKYSVDDFTTYEEFLPSNSEDGTSLTSIGFGWAVDPDGRVLMTYDGAITIRSADNNLLLFREWDSFTTTEAFNAFKDTIYRTTGGANTRKRAYNGSAVRQWEATPGANSLTIIGDHLYAVQGGTTGLIRKLDPSNGSTVDSWQTFTNLSVGTRSRQGVVPKYSDLDNIMLTIHDRTGTIVVSDYAQAEKITSFGTGGGTIAIRPLSKWRVHI